MRITPVDEPPDGDDGSDRASSRRSSSVREYVGRFCSWLLARVTDPGTRSDRSEPARGATQAREPPALEPVDGAERVTVPDFPSRDRPLTYPARDSEGINTPDVVGTQTEEGLRLSIPENPDAELTSDVWMDVEA